MLNQKRIEEEVRNCLVRAGTRFRKDQWEAYRKAIRKEESKNARWVLERICENAGIAKRRVFPLCDDTGIPHVFVEIGKDLTLPEGWLPAIHRGIA